MELNLSKNKVKSVILEKSKQMPFYTDLKQVFKDLGGKQMEFNWLITNLEYSVGLLWAPQNEKGEGFRQFLNSTVKMPPLR